MGQIQNLYYSSKLGETFFAAGLVPERMYMFDQDLKTGLSVIWNTGQTAKFTIDKVKYNLPKNAILFLSGIQKIDAYQFECLNVIQFNKAFYCVENHDNEVGCKGLLFFGSRLSPIVKIPKPKLKQFTLLWEIILMELEEEDTRLKVEMLRNLLKRYLILCVRLLHKQQLNGISSPKHIGLIREYNFLVEKHFKSKTQVIDYAKILFKSPKTLSNIFKKYIDKSPLQVINERRLIEAKRLLSYSDLSIQEIADELSFNDIQGFSNFIKKQIAQSPTTFRQGINK